MHKFITRSAVGAITLAGAVALSGCEVPSHSSMAGMGDRATPSGVASTEPTSVVDWSHAHGVHVTPDGATVLVATHEGLIDYSKGRPERIGSANDYMGFTGGGATLYASGHPGTGSNLPDPLGLIGSTDTGRTWVDLSRQGESDFHALTVTRGGLVGFDGTLLTTRDLKTWTRATNQIRPYALAGRPDTPVVLATTEDGLRRSTDAGRTWTTVPNAPLVQFAALSGPSTAVGVAPDGTVHTSTDAGQTWKQAGTVPEPVQAMTATEVGGQIQVWAVTGSGIQRSPDGGNTFHSYTGRVRH